MALLVDGDACPNLSQIKNIAQEAKVEMIVFVDYAHNLHDDYYKTIVCSVGSDSVDLVLLKYLKAGDLVITQDYGLAGLALSKGARVLHVSGKVINNDNIDQLLMMRYMAAKQRKSGVKTKGPAKRTAKVKNVFLEQLKEMLN